MNVFVVMAGVLYLCASVKYEIDGHPKMAVVFVMYAFANFVLATIKE